TGRLPAQQCHYMGAWGPVRRQGGWPRCRNRGHRCARQRRLRCNRSANEEYSHVAGPHFFRAETEEREAARREETFSRCGIDEESCEAETCRRSRARLEKSNERNCAPSTD